MTVSIHGVISHRKLMELKNCGVVEPEFFEEEVTKLFNFYRKVVAQSLYEMNDGFLTRIIYNERAAERDARWMFPDRRDLLNHLIYLDHQGRESSYVNISPKELNEFTLLHTAALASERARKVLVTFKYSDQVLVDDETGYYIDWLMKNAYILKGYIANAREED
ncbi:hypothetical protein SPLA5a_PHROGS00100 [Salmonella phage SPLA5a]|nr:hypothetical protein SPLA5a_PHROGS00100 [Salmonella phage SPLA5a]